jgi:surface carbohydrate biosynthesis protein
MSGEVSTLIVPVENQARELDAKLLLACVAAERGFPVILGSRAYIHYRVDSMPRGVYLAKSMRTLSDKMFDILRELGHEIVAWDEEGLVRPPDGYYYHRRVSDVAVAKVAALLAWGPDNAETFARHPVCSQRPIHVTGNPRIDMLRREVRPFHAEAVARLRERYGRFLLVNSNFGHVNHFVRSLRMAAHGGKPLDEFESALASHRSRIYGYFREMIAAVSEALPDETLVVRPHPVEVHEPWLELARGRPNVVVDNSGNVTPWLMAADAVIQNGCQTAIEASLVGTPVVNYKPAASDLDIELIESLGHEATNIDDLLKTLRSILNGELGPRDDPERKRHLERHLAALDGPLASDRVVSLLQEAGYGRRPPPPTPLATRLRGRARNRYRTLKKLNNMRKRGHRNDREFHDHRFPELSEDEVRGRVQSLSKHLGRFHGLRVRKTSRHIFEIDVVDDNSPTGRRAAW